MSHLLNISRLKYLNLLVRQRIRNLIYYVSSYQLQKDLDINGNTVFFVFDKSRKHPGLADRLKAVVCVYYIAKINGYKFKLIFSHPFELHEFFEPNKVDWLPIEGEMSYSLVNTRLMSYMGYGCLPILNKRIKQYHVYNYIGKNILENNNVEDWKVLWGDCFNELFKPTPLLKKLLDEQRQKENEYIAVHIRFVNSLKYFEDGCNSTLDSDGKANLIDQCLHKLTEIKQINYLPLLVFSDSGSFLKIAEMNGYSILDGKICHISNTIESESIQKTFLDFLMMARAQIVYSIIGDNLYASAFPKYAALAGIKEFRLMKL